MKPKLMLKASAAALVSNRSGAAFLGCDASSMPRAGQLIQLRQNAFHLLPIRLRCLCPLSMRDRSAS